MHFWKLVKQLDSLFSPRDVQKVLKIKLASAKVLCSRYTKKGDFLRLRRDLYMFKEVFIRLDQEKLFYVSAHIHSPSVVSFVTALSSYGFLPAHPDIIEAATPKRSKEFQVGHVMFKYHHLPKNLFLKKEEQIIASAEKAFLDILYLYSLGRYYLDLKKINLEAFSYKKLSEMRVYYPFRTQKLLAKIYSRALSV